jgi:hypothetical protein
MINHEKLLAAINALNSPPVPFTLENVALLPPLPYEGSNSWNTKITVMAKAGQAYSSQIDFYYRRIDLKEMGALTISSDQFFSTSSILTMLNNLNTAPDRQKPVLAEADLVSFSLPPFSLNGDAHVVSLLADDGSLGWIGQTEMLLAYNLPDVSALYQFMTETMPTPGYLP